MSEAKAVATISEGKKRATDITTFGAYLTKRKGAIAAVAASFMKPERIFQITMRTVVMAPSIQKCTMESIFRAALMAAELGLELGSPLGEAYAVPFNMKIKDPDGVERWYDICQMMIGYKGMIALSRRSGEIENISARAVYQGDKYEVHLGTDERIEHIPGDGPRDPKLLTGAYAVSWLKNTSRPLTEPMTRAEIDAIRARSKAKDNGPWVNDYQQMARKTTIRRLFNYLPKSIEMVKALTLENAIDTGDFSQVDFNCIEGEFVSPPEQEVIEAAAEPAKGTDAVLNKVKGSKDVTATASDESRDPETGRTAKEQAEYVAQCEAQVAKEQAAAAAKTAKPQTQQPPSLLDEPEDNRDPGVPGAFQN